ncbi:MAG: DUF3800 domain-containing protein [Actinomycetota bacterium]
MEIVGHITDSEPSIFVFIDESGDLLPMEAGTTHLVLSALITKSPSAAANIVSNLRYSLLSKGFNIETFHATDDSRLVRSEFLQQIRKIRDAIGVTIGIKKMEHTTSKEVIGIYIQSLAQIAAEVVRLNVDNVQVIFLIDPTLDKKSRSEAKRAIKYVFSSSNQRSMIYFQSMKRDFCGQIADYLAWSHFQKVERKTDYYLRLITEAFNTKFLELDDPPG